MKVQDLVYRIGATNTGLKTAVRDSQQSIRSLMDTANQGVRSLENMSRKMFRTGTILFTGISALTKKTINSAASFEKSMRRVQAISQSTASEYRKLSTAALEMSTRTEHSATAVAEGMNFMAMAGFKANEIMEAMPSVLQLASAGVMDLGTAADITTNILTGYGMEISELVAANDVLVSAMTGANVDLVDLGQSFKYVGPIAKAAGIEFSETAAMIALMGNAGIQGSMAGTSLRQALTNLLNPTKQARDIMDRLGIKTRDTNDNLLSMTEILRQLEDRGASASDMMVLFGQRAGPAMSALLGQGVDELEKFQQRLGDAEGLAAKIEAMMVDTAEGQKTIFKNTANAIRIMFGQDMIPYYRTAVFFLQGIADKIRQMEPEQRMQIIRITAITGAVVGLVAVLGFLGMAVAGIVKGFLSFGGAIMFLMSMKGLAIGALILAVGLLKKAWENDWLSIRTTTQEVVDEILKLWDSLLEWWDESKLRQWIVDTWEQIRDVWEDEDLTLGQKVLGTVSIVANEIIDLIPGLREIWNTWTDDDLNLGQKVINTVSIVVNTVANLIESINAWWTGQVVKLARKTAELLGLDPDEAWFVQLAEDLNTIWTNEELTFDEKIIESLKLIPGAEVITDFIEDVKDKTEVAVSFILAQWNRFLTWIGWEGLQAKAKKYWADLLIIWNDETTKFPDKVNKTIALTTDFIFGPGTSESIAKYWNDLQAIWLSEELSIRGKLSKTFVLTMDFILSEETKTNIENYWNTLTDIWTDEETNLSDKFKLTFDATKVFLGFELEPEGDVVDALKEGAGGEWGRFWKLVSDGWSGIAILLLTLQLTSTAIKGILLAIGSVFGNVTGELGVGGVPLAIGLLSVGIQLAEAFGEGTFDNFVRNVLVAALTGAIAGAVFGGPTMALLGFNLAINLKLGEVAEDIPKAIGEQFGIPREHWEQLEAYEEYRQEMIDNSGLSWWERFIGKKPEGLLGFQEWLVEMGYATEPAEEGPSVSQEDLISIASRYSAPSSTSMTNIRAMQEFFEQGGRDAAQRAADELGIPVEWVLAQWGLETSYFQSELMDVFNLGGVKAAPGEDSVQKWTWEEVDGKKERVLADFKVYESIDEYVDDWVAAIGKKWQHAIDASTLEEYIAGLTDASLYESGDGWVGRYATDSNYLQSVEDVLFNIERYLAFDALEDMAADHGYDYVSHFVNGVAEGAVELSGDAAENFVQLVERWVHDIPANDAIAFRWGGDFVRYFVDGAEAEALRQRARMEEIAAFTLMPMTFDNPENDAWIFDSGVDLMQWFGKGISSAAQGVVEIVKMLMDKVFDAILKVIQERYPELIEFFNDLKAEVDEGIKAVEEFVSKLGGDGEGEKTIKELDAVTTSWLQNLSNGLASAIVHGESLYDVFDNFLRMVAQQALSGFFMRGMTTVLATAGYSIPTMHFGGLVMHSGGMIDGLRPDEVPIIAQKGERILSRKQNDQFENMLANQQFGSGLQIDKIEIHAVDSKSFTDMLVNNPDAVTYIVGNNLINNGELRKLLMNMLG